MSKRKRWWGGGETKSMFPNSVAQHEKRIKQDAEGYWTEEEDYGYSSSWDWDRKLLGKQQDLTGNKTEDKANKYALTTSEYSSHYKSYEKTGYWGGYARVPQLTYKYVQQMANALSASHNIKVEVGNDWNVDLLKKTLTYNPASLIYGTKSELLATLMHEIGKLRYVTHNSRLNNKYLTMYKQPAMEVLSIYEDVRTDFLMLKSYESASEIYESVIPTIEKQVKDYMKYGQSFRKVIGDVPKMMYDNIIQQTRGDPQRTQTELMNTFGTTDTKKIEANLEKLEESLDENGTIYEYCGEMLSLMYDLDEQGHRKFENITEKVEKTVDTIEPAKKAADSQALVDFLDSSTYPIVEDLLKDAHDKQEQLKKAFPEMPAAARRQMVQQIEYYLGNGNAPGVNIDEQGNTKTRSSGKSNSSIPPEWEAGDYKTLKDSVSMEIRQLVNRLTFIRREELTVRYEADQKRGRLNSRKLYKSSTGSRRLFKTKLENTDTIQSFAFSVLLDISGSMAGPRIVHCTRALIILAEVFKKMGIPFELVTFSDGVKHIKGFGVELDKTMEKKIGGLPQHLGGGTNLHNGLEALKIHSQPEKNKIVIVLTDGGVGGAKYFDEKYFIPWTKKGIKSVGFGVECESEMAKLCQGNSKVLKNASQLPVEFSNLLKSLIKR